jgi:hypothetical protein
MLSMAIRCAVQCTYPTNLSHPCCSTVCSNPDVSQSQAMLYALTMQPMFGLMIMCILLMAIGLLALWRRRQ